MYASSSALANSTAVLSSAAPPTFIGATNAATSSGTSLTFAVPSGALVDDLLLVCVSLRSAATITGPSGWTAEAPVMNGTALTQRVHRKTALSSDLTVTHTVTWTGATKAAGVLVAMRGIRLSSPIVNSTGQANASAASIAVPGLTLSAQAMMDLLIVSKAHSDAHSAASGYTLNAAATVASGPLGATANRVSVHYRTFTLANPPSTTIAAGTTAAVSIGAHLALAVEGVTGFTETASRGTLALTGAAATLQTTPYLLQAAPGAVALTGRVATDVYNTTWIVIATLGAAAASHSDTTAAPGTTYRYRVAAVNAFATTLSNEQTATTISGSTFALIAEPRVFLMTGATNGATLGVAQLAALRGTVIGSGVAATLTHTTPVYELVETLGLASSYSDFGLDPSTGYVYRIVAGNAGGTTVSNQVVVFTLAATVDDALPALKGTYVSTGALATATLGIALLADDGACVVTGKPATLTNVRLVIAGAASYAASGAAAMVVATTRVAAMAGSVAIAGTAATFVRVIAGQQAVPVADVADGAWTPSAGIDLYATIDEASDEPPADTDYMQTVTPTADTAVVELSDLATPATGDVQILVRTRTG